MSILQMIRIESVTAAERTEETNLQTNPIETETSGTAPSATQHTDVAVTITNENDNNNDKAPITFNVIVEPFANVETSDAVTIATIENSDPVLDTVDLETNRTEVINSSADNDIKQKTDEHCVNSNNTFNESSVELSSLDAALDNLNEKVASLLDEASATKVKSDSPDAPLDEALATLNTEVLGLLKESRKIQDELQSSGSSKGAVHKEGNKYFDYTLYRERSISPPPHPPITYRWEDIRRDKEKVIELFLNNRNDFNVCSFTSGWISVDVFGSTRVG